MREYDTMLSIKSRITPVIEKLPSYFEIGQIQLIILHARLRNFWSYLNYDLFQVKSDSKIPRVSAEIHANTRFTFSLNIRFMICVV